MNATLSPGLAYDAISILGFGPVSDETLPEAAPGEIVIRYGGWSLQELRDSDIGQTFMYQQGWYDKYPWSIEKLPAGIYRLRVPVPDSNRKTFEEQEAMLPSGEQVAPVVLVPTAMLAHHLQKGEDLLKNDWTRFKAQAAGGGHVILGWSEGRLRVLNYWDVNRRDGVWVSSLRTS